MHTSLFSISVFPIFLLSVPMVIMGDTAFRKENYEKARSENIIKDWPGEESQRLALKGKEETITKQEKNIIDWEANIKTQEIK